MSIKSNNKSKIKFFIGNEYLKKCIRIITNNNTIFRLGDCFNYDEYLTMEIILKLIILSDLENLIINIQSK